MIDVADVAPPSVLTRAMDAFALGLSVRVSVDGHVLEYDRDRSGMCLMWLTNHPESTVEILGDVPDAVRSGKEKPRIYRNAAPRRMIFGDAPLDKVITALEEHGYPVRERARQWRAKCPYHGGRSSDSLALTETADGTCLMHCHAGCSAADVLAVIGLTLADLYVREPDPTPEWLEWLVTGPGYIQGEMRRLQEESAAQKRPATGMPKTVFVTAAEMAAEESEPILYVAKPYVAKNCATNVIARVKMGKTTFILALVAAKVQGCNFLGEVLNPGPVVYLTEERKATFGKALERAGIANHPDVHILFRSATRDLTWPATVDLAVDHCKAVGAELLVVDTVPRWAGVKEDDENASGAARAAMEPLEAAAGEGLAVVLGFHARKSGGSVADALAGSREWNGSADVIVQLTKPSGHRPTVREIEAEGRLDVPDRVLIERLEDGTFALLGERADVKRRELWRLIHAFVADHSDCTVAEITGAAKEEGLVTSRSSVERALAQMDSVKVSQAAKGKEPARYRVAGLQVIDGGLA